MLGLAAALEDLLEGRVTPQEADPRILNWAEFMIHKRAQAVLALPTKLDRQEALMQTHENIRPYVEREAKKIWIHRKDNDNTSE